ncbi:energy transducer TonB [Salinibacter altiplanensis]|uniref:energy transducer TonB n=1 Tax=Salinibacter altiplanensis TaxID=1803181 RepID=UPI001F46A651|nr:energy transducer TonB [Salinibacter altiplanensis]
MFSTRNVGTAFIGIFFLFVVGCGGGNSPTAAPDGWQTSDLHWWEEGADTSAVFTNLDSLSGMGVGTAEVQLAANGDVTPEQFQAAIKRSLLPLYRNNPMVVDSLFGEYAAPQLEEVDLSGDVLQSNGELKSDLLNKNQKMAYEAITEYFREPQREQSPDNIVWPDSLRSEEYSGVVKLQVHLAPEGEGEEAVARANAVEVLSGPHPTLNRIALKAATQATWQPAYVLEDGSWSPTESWVQFNIPFQTR